MKKHIHISDSNEFLKGLFPISRFVFMQKRYSNLRELLHLLKFSRKCFKKQQKDYYMDIISMFDDERVYCYKSSYCDNEIECIHYKHNNYKCYIQMWFD